MKVKRLPLLLLSAAVLTACVTSPTGRTQFMLISPEAAIVESQRAYATTMRTVGQEGRFLYASASNSPLALATTPPPAYRCGAKWKP